MYVMYSLSVVRMSSDCSLLLNDKNVHRFGVINLKSLLRTARAVVCVCVDEFTGNVNGVWVMCDMLLAEYNESYEL